VAAAYWVFAQPDLTDRFGFTPAHPAFGGFVLGLFLHQNLLHLFGNMVFLAAVGPAVEYAAGSWRFLAVYFLGGVVGILAHWVLISPAAASIPLVGASGCVAACLGYYSIRYIGLKVPIAPGVGVPVVVIALVWVLLQAAGAFVQIGSDQVGTAFWSHLGGFASGLLLSLVFRAPTLASVQLGHEVLDRMNQRGPAAALAMSERYLAEHPGDVQAMFKKAEAENVLGEDDAESATLLSLFELVSDKDLPKVIDRLDGLGSLSVLPSNRRILLAERLKAAHPATARKLLKSVADGPDDDSQKPEALLSLAAIEWDAGGSGPWLRELFEKYPLHPAAESARSRGWKA
jgi:membrane associated rhomboid family serine protease